jgi:hypothetical protein
MYFCQGQLPIAVRSALEDRHIQETRLAVSYKTLCDQKHTLRSIERAVVHVTVEG